VEEAGELPEAGDRRKPAGSWLCGTDRGSHEEERGSDRSECTITAAGVRGHSQF
jgi:hypothetical protein